MFKKDQFKKKFKKDRFLFVYVCPWVCGVCTSTHPCAFTEGRKGYQVSSSSPTFSFEEPKAHVFLSRPTASLRDSPVPVPLRVGFQACLGCPASYSGSHDCVIRPLHHWTISPATKTGFQLVKPKDSCRWEIIFWNKKNKEMFKAFNRCFNSFKSTLNNGTKSQSSIGWGYPPVLAVFSHGRWQSHSNSYTEFIQ